MHMPDSDGLAADASNSSRFIANIWGFMYFTSLVG